MPVIDPDITVAIVSYRTPELAQKCADSINTGSLRASVAIVETGEEIVPHPGPPPRFYMPGAGYSAALQAVFRGSKSQYLIACNADTEFPGESIEPLISLFVDWPRVGVIGPRQVNPDGRIVHAGISEPGSTTGGSHYGLPDAGQCKEPIAFVAQISGSVMLIRRSAFEEVGGMTNMPHLYYEDAKLCLRLRREGWRVAYSGLQTFTHHVAASPEPPDGRVQLATAAREAWVKEFCPTG